MDCIYIFAEYVTLHVQVRKRSIQVDTSAVGAAELGIIADTTAVWVETITYREEFTISRV